MRIPATKATAEVPEVELLDRHPRVRPEHPGETEEQEKKVYPTSAKRSRVTPVVLRDVLKARARGQVRVLPTDGTGMDLFVDGKILVGRPRRLAIRRPTTGRVWLDKSMRARPTRV